jgi:hypothetical protein
LLNAQDFRHGNYLFRADKIPDAILQYSTALSKLKQYDTFPEKDSSAPGVISSLSAQHFADGRSLGAKTLMHHAESQRAQLDDYQAMHDPCLVTLAQTMKHEIVDRKLPPFQRIVVAVVEHHTCIDSITADLMNNLGACFEVQLNLEQARQFYNESLKLRKVIKTY